MEIRPRQASGRFDSAVGAPVVTHTGMMDAAIRWRSGEITERAYVAGLLAFVAATTNNQSVMVDFASWVQDRSGGGLVLGNVESADPPRYAESVYYAFENDDGSLGFAVGPASWQAGRWADQLPSSYDDLDAAYQLYRAGRSARPIPIRCGGALFLNARYGEPVEAGKCDSWISWTMGSIEGARPWDTVAGTTAPMNGYMLLPADARTPLRRDGRVVLSETYIHLWDAAYEHEDRGQLARPTLSAP
jgi:hypothetical protein